MAKFKVGDKVLVKTLNEISDWAFDYQYTYDHQPSEQERIFFDVLIKFYPYFTERMVKTCGKKYTIISIHKDRKIKKENTDDHYIYTLNTRERNNYREEWLTLVKEDK